MPTQPYTNANAVKDLLRSNYDGCSPLEPYIRAAQGLIGRMIACATNKSYTHTTDELRSIAEALSAHFYCAMDALYMSRSTSKASGSFQRTTGKRLEGTEYGQMALTLDASGCLDAISKSAFASLTWLGLEPSAQTDYDDRD